MKSIELFRDILAQADQIMQLDHVDRIGRQHSLVLDNREVEKPVGPGILLILYLGKHSVVIGINRVDDLPWDNDHMLVPAIETHVNKMISDDLVDQMMDDIYAIQRHQNL